MTGNLRGFLRGFVCFLEVGRAGNLARVPRCKNCLSESISWDEAGLRCKCPSSFRMELCKLSVICHDGPVFHFHRFV